MATTVVSPTVLQSHNPYNRASTTTQDSEELPHPSNSTTHSISNPQIELQSMRASGSGHGASGAGHPGIIERLEEGLHEITDKVEHEFHHDERSRRQSMWDRFRGKGRRRIGWGESVRNTLKSSILNVLLVFIPFAWATHWADAWKANSNATFALCFLSIVSLEKLFDFGGEQMALYTGKDLGDLIIITLDNVIEATLAIVLLLKCELRILQATIVGVVLLHLLLVPGTGFLTGGARIYEQTLHPHYVQLNHTLLAIGVLSLLVPAAFFAALDNSAAAQSTLTSNASRMNFIVMSRGIAILLLTVYIASRIFLHNPPGDDNAFRPSDNAPEAVKHEEDHLREKTPKVNPWFCVIFLIVIIAISAVTAEMLVESIEHVREEGGIGDEWFGLILLPIVSFSADGAVTILYFLRRVFFMKPEPPKTLAEDRAIDLSIQFTLFWMPVLILLSWWTGRPLMLLFDMYEVAVLLGASFLVNYVTADSKTNWAEGYIMIIFYVIIALCTWFYPGQESIANMYSGCKAGEVGGDTLGEVAAIAEEVVSEVVNDLVKRI